MRVTTFAPTVCCCLLLASANAWAQDEPAKGPPPVQAGIGFIGAGAVGDFGARVDAAAGVLLQMDVQLAKSIFSVGGEWAGMGYGHESRDAYIGNVIPDMPNLTLKVNTDNDLWFLQARVRAQRKSGRWRPYGDGLVGIMNISTTTSINGAQSCSAGGYSTCSADQAASVTNADETVLSFGGGAGTIVTFGRRDAVPRLDISVRYQHGDEARYLTKGAIIREGDRATFNISQSSIDMVMVYIGLSLGR